MSQHTHHPIDRVSLVRRHNPNMTALNPRSPLQIGNGTLAFAADITGFQTFPEAYEVPLGTLSQWAWHTSPPPKGLDFALTPYDTYGRLIGYPVSAKGQEDAYTWLRGNPHRVHLGRIGLKLLLQNGQRVHVTDLQDPLQSLDLWTGELKSSYRVEGIPVRVQTYCHPEREIIAFNVSSPLIRLGRLMITIDFPAPDSKWKADWNSLSGSHETTVTRRAGQTAEFVRVMDRNSYVMTAHWHPGGDLVQEKHHSFLLIPHHADDSLSLVCAFSQQPATECLPSPTEVEMASAEWWSRFWVVGGAIELTASNDVRANELERRIVLSQYLTAINCAGSLPPQETGLLCNSWHGKFHLEMHWWHAAHFALWNRTQLLEKSMKWYLDILEVAQQTAQHQGYSGARWPKMVGPEGRESPSGIGPFLIWQQPHPIMLAEYCYQAHPDRNTLERYIDLVQETADFMASYTVWDEQRQRYVLGPPLIPAQENHKPETTYNPTFELAYWAYGLETAQKWRLRLGIPRNVLWDRVLAHLSSLPVQDGVYLAHENCPDTYTGRNWDHPSMLAALGMLPGRDVDACVMRRTLQKVLQEWQWSRTWGWDYPLVAMSAARLGEPGLAVDILLMDMPKNTYLPNGHNWQGENLPAYLPGNGGLLTATAMMAAGWGDSSGRDAPGFPKDGSWQVRWENLSPLE